MAGKHHRGVDRIVAIMEAVTRAKSGLSLTEIARILDAPVSSAQQLINGLIATGFLNESNRKFTLGPGVFALTMGADWRSVAPVSHDILENLSSDLDCSIVLGLLVGDSMIYFDEAGDDPAINYYAKTRSRRPLLVSAGGKLLLAHLPHAELQERLQSLSETSPASHIDNFLSECSQIRETGLAYGAALDGVVAVAAGIPGKRDKLAAALIAGGTKQAMEPRLDEVGAILLERLGHLHK